MNKWYFNLLYFLIVLFPYIILLSYTAYAYPHLPDKLAHVLPKLVIWVPAAISVILPLTYGILVFGFREYLRKAYSLILAVFMAIALLALTVLVHLISSSW